MQQQFIYFLVSDAADSVLLLEAEADRRRSIFLSFASFMRWARSFAYSAASSRFLVARCFLRASRWRLRWRTTGVTSRWIFGAFVRGFLPTNDSYNVIRCDRTNIGGSFQTGHLTIYMCIPMGHTNCVCLSTRDGQTAGPNVVASWGQSLKWVLLQDTAKLKKNRVAICDKAVRYLIVNMVIRVRFSSGA